MKIATIQVEQRVFYDVNNPIDFDKEKGTLLCEDAIQETYELVESACQKGADIIVTPETINYCFLPGDRRYQLSDTAEKIDGSIVKKFSGLAKEYKTYILLGLLLRRNKEIYNSAILIDRNGMIEEIYDKIHLTEGEIPYIESGKEYKIIETEFGKIGLLICWDLQFPEAVRELVLQDVDLICVPTWGWEHIYGLARAYENCVNLAVSMMLPKNGLEQLRYPSEIVNIYGDVLSSAPSKTKGIAFANIDIKDRGEYASPTKSGAKNIRDTRLSQRRPDTYQQISESEE